MISYRVYWMDRARRIRRGEWIDAIDDDDARRQAETLCDGDSASLEVWQEARPVDHIDCGEAA